MNQPRTKLTRRRGACEECRQKKVRCDGANPCNHCQRNESRCKYNIRHSRRRLQEKSTQGPDHHVATTTQPYAVDGNAMPDSSNQDRSEIVTGQDIEGSANPLNTPFSEECFSQLVSDSAHSYLDFDFPDETILSTNHIQIIDQQTDSFHNQIPHYISRNNTPMLDWLITDHDEHLHQHSTAQFCDTVETEQEDGVTERTLTLFSERTVADKKKLLSIHKTYKIITLFQNADGSSRRRHSLLDKVKVLLSPEHHTCLSKLLRKIDFGKKHQSLGLNDLPMGKLIRRAFKEPGGLSLFIKEHDVTRIQKLFFDPKKPPIEVSDMSLLIISLTWGALLEPEVRSGSKVALLDAMLETSSLLLRQNSSIRKLLALVAMLCLAEKTGSDNLLALLTGSISTAASLALHLEPSLRNFCASDEQVIQTKRAMLLLYCIDKSYALRWQTFSLLSDGALPTTNLSDNVLESGFATTQSLEWLQIRFEYSKICENIMQIKVGAEAKSPEDRSNRAVTLSTALEEWYRSASISQMRLSLDHNDAMRVKLQISHYYYEARVELLSINLPDPQPSYVTVSQECTQLLRQSTRDIITCSSTIPSEFLLQDCNHLYINKLALCFLALDILLEVNGSTSKGSRAFLSIVAGFFARMGVLLPQASVFEEVSDFIETLMYL
ncbi:hypothetical protein COCC4DRAFT_182581 [Bipolaris maydis ATCC 48331]|uniref:Zn(2)-C6 fungal-type domain-containing protein n=2 Tax=Cochliobolus heterostrophus TaxID=5016 RepID=M2SHN5_COCH5|nr:uncharacterized protein COCC4DRAFT_182581 [Bipolaris maydis ATCC 48331]EMD84890.1 hypothetical protein COCHEDRAFT_1199253 [Bipolaris maydis C5]KAJ5021995.1 hypothetical protein J3E73DRAFT_240592 [Bipolaris maydis]ENH98584.1 hypothetical protein COCC4DRAFT_182581 [Bipolaris maydis ATCC 48331]KAJ5029808.1 hypothetical protein J3E73DRAFT_207049 [Bipolaris maydis]KAJ6275578.1 hypothetical protein PSV08DRAFT_213312 [Bipolaris maydis]